MRIDPDITMRNLGEATWPRLLKLCSAAPRRPSDRPRRALILRVREGSRVLKLWHSELGRLPLDARPVELSAEALSSSFDGARVFSVTPAALQSVATRWQLSVGPELDLVAQLLGLLEARQATPGVDVFPRQGRLGTSRFARMTSLELLLPVGRSLVFLVTREGRVHASLIIRRGRHGLDLVTSHEDFVESELELPAQVRPVDVDLLGAACGARGLAPQLCVGVELRAFWDWRRDPRTAHRKALERRGALALRLPLAWKLLLRGLEWRGGQRRGDEDRRAPLDDYEYAECS